MLFKFHSLFGAGREAFDLYLTSLELRPKFLLEPPDLDPIEFGFLPVDLDVL